MNNREYYKELLPIIQAFADGKVIQFRCKSGEWVEIRNDEIDFSLSPNDYRIKPNPKYRPFKNQEECWNEMHKHPDFGWVLCDGVYLHLLDVYCDATHTNEQHDGIDYDDALGELTFTDGTPFGIKEE